MTMTVSLSFREAQESMLKLFRHRRESSRELGEQPQPSGCGEDARCRVRRLALEELRSAGLIGQKLDKLQQAEIGLKVSRRLLQEDIERRCAP